MKKIKEKCFKLYLSGMNRIQKLSKDVRGMGTIEVVLIVAILVALALVFKVFINKYATGIFDNIEDKTSAAFENW